ncbi:MAG: PAS domain S-box protein [Acidobacteriota bacterium]
MQSESGVMPWASPERLAALTELSSEAIVAVDGRGVVLWASRSTAAVLGYDPAALVGTRLRDLVAADDLPAWSALVEELLDRPGASKIGAFRCRHHDGTFRWVEGTAQNLLLEPVIGAIVVHYRDATANKDLEAVLRGTESRYAYLFEQAADVIFETDPEGYFRVVNPATLRVFGYGIDEVIGRRFTEFIHPDHRNRVFRHYLKQTDEGVTTSYIEFMAVTKDGREVWLGQNAWMMFDHEGRFRGFQAVARDITEQRRTEEALREAEAKYRSVVEQSLVAVYILQDNKIVYVNPKGAELLGYAADELVGSPPIHLVVEADRGFVASELARVSHAGAQSVQFVARARRKDGTLMQGEAYCAPTEYERRPAVLVTVLDVTDRSRLEEQLRQSQKMEAIGRLAGGIAHDFNNLLTAIRGNAELLQHRFRKDPVLSADIDEVVQAADRAASLTRQLLLFSRKQDFQTARLNLNDTVESVARMVRRLIGPNVQLEIARDPRLGDVQADPAQTEQVLLNLIVNARDALPEGGRIRVTTANVDITAHGPGAETGLQPGAYVRLSVTDDGIGMDEATQLRIFEPFFTTKEPGRGTGLGLSTVYGIIQQMGGTIMVTSARGAGATFDVYLPRVEQNP